MRAAIAVVVVFPFVPETRATPAGSRAASTSMAPGSSFQSSLPGSVVPPPRPVARDRRPTARAAIVSSVRRAFTRASVPGRESAAVGPAALASCNFNNLLYSTCVARRRRRHPALAGIDEEALAAFRAGLRRRYTDDEILAGAARLGGAARPLAHHARVRGRPRGPRPSADGDRALRHLECGQARRGPFAATLHQS